MRALFFFLSWLIIYSSHAQENTWKELLTQDVIAQVIKDIEKQTGKSFKEIPKISYVTRFNHFEFMASIDRDDEDAAIKAGVDPSTLSPKGLSLGASALGYYSFLENTVFLNTGVLDYFCDAITKKYGSCNKLALVKAVLTHELIHRLQAEFLDQSFLQVMHYINEKEGAEAGNVFASIIEGQAVLLEERLSAFWNHEPPYDSIMSFMLQLNIDLAETYPSELNDIAIETIKFTFFTGKDFLKGQTKKHSDKRMWDLLLDPPKTVQEIEPALTSQAFCKSIL